MRAMLLLAAALWLWPLTVWAQPYPIPFEASAGLGVLRDQTLSEWVPTVMGTLSWDYDEDWWAVPVMEGEFITTSEATPCRHPPGSEASTCVDAALLGGLRVRRPPHADSGIKPFGQVVLGAYWKGSGADSPEYVSSHFAMQGGGGIEIRWPGSIQGIRISVDVRHVFAHEARNQIRLGCAYVIGPRRFKRPHA